MVTSWVTGYWPPLRGPPKRGERGVGERRFPKRRPQKPRHDGPTVTLCEVVGRGKAGGECGLGGVRRNARRRRGASGGVLAPGAWLCLRSPAPSSPPPCFTPSRTHQLVPGSDLKRHVARGAVPGLRPRRGTGAPLRQRPLRQLHPPRQEHVRLDAAAQRAPDLGLHCAGRPPRLAPSSRPRPPHAYAREEWRVEKGGAQGARDRRSSRTQVLQGPDGGYLSPPRCSPATSTRLSPTFSPDRPNLAGWAGSPWADGLPAGNAM